jgi:diguanylate cyclase (GGDEF)-like protein/putative nucleotidyltransferase with HDIG domain
VGLSAKARLYIASASIAGLAVTARASLDWTSEDPLRFLAYAVVTAIASGLKVTLPGITGTLSVSYIFILSSIVQLSFGETVCLSILSALVQCLWQAKERPRLVHLMFNTSTIAVSTSLSYSAYHLWPDRFSMVFALASACCAYFLANTLSVSGIVAATEDKSVAVIWKSAYFWSFPYYLLGASLAACISYLSKFLNWEISLAVLPLVFFIYRSYGLYLKQLEEQKRHAETTASLHLRTIEALALAIEAKDQTTGEHLKRVQVYAREIAKDLGLSEDERQALQAASILHDVGKLAVPDYIISKPGRLTPEEFDKMKIHPIVGAEILERIDFPYPVVPIVRAHHEKWDGSGYPFGLEGEQIPIGARILSAVDCFDALASDRQYRKALPLDQAMAMVVHESAKSFDPRVVDVLRRRYLQLEKIAAAEQTPEHAKLSTDLKVSRGDSPDAGFEVAVPVKAAANDSDEESLISVAAAHEQAQALYEFSRVLGSSFGLAETLAVISTRVRNLVQCDSLVLYMLEGDILVPRYVFGENQKLFSSLRIAVGEGVSGWVAETKRSILNGNPAVEPGYLNDPARFSTLRSVLAVPLQASAGTLGVLAVYKSEKDGFSRNDLRILLAINSKISLAVENAVSCQTAKPSTDLDPTTGLPNASALFLHVEHELASCQSANSSLTIFVCDLDGFNQVNAFYGHVAGDRMLQLVANGFRKSCRERDYLARRGGDEFVLVLPGLPQEAVESRISALTGVVHQAAREIGDTENLSVSIGGATYPQDGGDPETLLGEAERRMHFSKRAHKARPSMSTTDMLARLKDSVAKVSSFQVAETTQPGHDAPVTAGSKRFSG